jgi:hypothetical protein
LTFSNPCFVQRIKKSEKERENFRISPAVTRKTSSWKIKRTKKIRGFSCNEVPKRKLLTILRTKQQKCNVKTAFDFGLSQLDALSKTVKLGQRMHVSQGES